jgi:hypothetical protein
VEPTPVLGVRLSSEAAVPGTSGGWCLRASALAYPGEDEWHFNRCFPKHSPPLPSQPLLRRAALPDAEGVQGSTAGRSSMHLQAIPPNSPQNHMKIRQALQRIIHLVPKFALRHALAGEVVLRGGPVPSVRHIACLAAARGLGHAIVVAADCPSPLLDLATNLISVRKQAPV